MSYRRWLLVAAAIYGLGIVIGLLTPLAPLAGDAADFEELAWLAELPQSLLFIFILFKNSLALLVSFALAPIFLLMPLIALTLNGQLLAVVSVIVVQEESLGFLAVGLLPHGIIEIPAFLIAQAAALSFGTAVVVSLFKKEKRELVLPSLRRNVKYLSLALVLLVPAAVIEVYITPLAIGWFSG